MDHERALARAEHDLARGHTHVAIQRLTTLVQQDPSNRELRTRLSDVHLATGNLVQAGRWAYLDEAADAGVIAAFERAYPHVRARATALRWAHSTDTIGPLATARLARLTDVAVDADDTDERLLRHRDGRREWATIGCFYVAAAIGVAALVAFVVGVATILRALF